MRYTVESTAKIGKRVRVFVDGKEVGRCIMADTNKGVVEYYPIDPRSGKVRVNGKRSDLVVKRRYGKVTVEAWDD